MLPIGYFSAAGLMAVGGVKFILGDAARKEKVKLEAAVNETLPLDNEVKFLAIRCLAEQLPVNSRIIPEKPCYFWRATVTKSKTNFDIGVGPIGSEKTDFSVIVTPKHRQHTEMVGFPNPLLPICNIGTIAVRNLDLAKWEDGFHTKISHFKPIESASLLWSLDIKPDLSADFYHFVINQFMKPEFTVFGVVTKNENGYSVDSRVVTSLTPEEYIDDKRFYERKTIRKAKLYGLGGCILGSATWTIAAQRDCFSQYWEMYRYSRSYKDIKILSYSRLAVGYAALITSVYAFQKSYNS